MTAEPNIDLESNPFSNPFEDDSAAASSASAAAERLKSAAGDNIRRLRDAAEAGFRTFRDSADEAPAAATAKPGAPNWEEIRGKLKDLQREGEAWARENPTGAVAIAAGAGFILGMLLKR